MVRLVGRMSVLNQGSEEGREPFRVWLNAKGPQPGSAAGSPSAISPWGHCTNRPLSIRLREIAICTNIAANHPSGDSKSTDRRSRFGGSALGDGRPPSATALEFVCDSDGCRAPIPGA